MLDGNGGLIGDGLEQLDLFAGEHAHCLIPHHHLSREQGAQPLLLGHIPVDLLLSSKTSGPVKFWHSSYYFFAAADHLLEVHQISI